MVESVGIVGAGTMGSGIAQVCVAAGKRVRLYDADAVALTTGRQRVIDGLDRSVAKERLTSRQRDAAIDALDLVAGLPAVVEGADLVVEAAAENLEVKERIFRELDGLAAADVVLATNTSSLSVAACAAATRRPERVIGLHFFNPAPLMALVEIAATDRTDRPTFARAIEFVESLGKTVVHCADAPGFIVNRVGRPYLTEAVRMLEAGEGTVAGIDAALEAAAYPMGPFRLIDLIGLDVDLAIDRTLFDAFDAAARFDPPELQQSLSTMAAWAARVATASTAMGPSGQPRPTSRRSKDLCCCPMSPSSSAWSWRPSTRLTVRSKRAWPPHRTWTPPCASAPATRRDRSSVSMSSVSATSSLDCASCTPLRLSARATSTK